MANNLVSPSKMSLLSSFRALPPRTRAMIGASFIAWGTIGLYLSDTAEKKLGFEPTEQDKAKMPKFTIVEKENWNGCDGWMFCRPSKQWHGAADRDESG